MKYDVLAPEEVVTKTITALGERGITGSYVNSSGEALTKIQEMIPQGASVMNGASRTLEEIGFVDYLKSGAHGWNNLHEAILAEKDKAKQSKMRKEAVLSDFYLGSVHAVTEDGQLIIASNTGSQLPHLVYTSPNIILVVGTQKIMPNLDEAFVRLEEYVFPLEDQRMKDTGGSGSAISKVLIFKREQAFLGRQVSLIFVNEKLGF